MISLSVLSLTSFPSLEGVRDYKGISKVFQKASIRGFRGRNCVSQSSEHRFGVKGQEGGLLILIV